MRRHKIRMLFHSKEAKLELKHVARKLIFATIVGVKN